MDESKLSASNFSMVSLVKAAPFVKAIEFEAHLWRPKWESEVKIAYAKVAGSMSVSGMSSRQIVGQFAA